MKAKITFLFLITFLSSLAQEKTDLKTFGKAVMDKFPTTRTFDVQYDNITPTNFDSKLFGKPFESGRIENHNRVKVAFNMPFYASKSRRFVLTASLRYKYETYDFGDIYNINSSTSYTRENQEIHYFAGALSTTFISTLFKKPVIYNATVSVDANQDNFERVKGFISANLVLKKTQNTTITVGAMAMIDPSSIIPFTPLFSYNHKFDNSKWHIDFVLPQRLLFRREVFENGRVSFGTELNSENFYLDINSPSLKGIYELNQLDLKSGITYEHRISAKIFAMAKVGVSNIVSIRITEKGEKTTDYIYDQKEDAQGYFRIGLSYNPF